MWVSLVPRLSCVGSTWQAGDKTIYGCVLMSDIVAIRKYTQAKGLGKSYCQCSECLTRPWASLAASLMGYPFNECLTRTGACCQSLLVGSTLGKHTVRWEGLITSDKITVSHFDLSPSPISPLPSPLSLPFSSLPARGASQVVPLGLVPGVQPLDWTMDWNTGMDYGLSVTHGLQVFDCSCVGRSRRCGVV